MPIYEYQCAACGQVVEKWQKVSESPLTDCPACGGGLSKIISSCAFHLKGGGWYVTDYAGKNPSAGSGEKSGDAPKETAGVGEPAKAGSAKTEAAPKIK